MTTVGASRPASGAWAQSNEIIINGRFLCQRATGVQRVSAEFAMALDRLLGEGLFAGLTVRLVAPVGADFGSLGLQSILTEHLPGGQGYRWEQLSLPRRARYACLLCLGNTAPIIGMIRGDQIAVMLHDQAHRLFPEDYSVGYRIAHRLMDWLILRHARPVFTVSETERETIRTANPDALARIIVAANGSWIEDCAVEPGDPAARVGGYGLYVGGFSTRKNIDGVFATAIALAEEGHPFRFVGAPNARSDAFRDRLRGAARELITFCGYVANDELAALYRGATYLLYPSFYEASGLPPSEAMTFGCPVIVSDLPVLHERCGDAALYCDPYDRSSIMAAARRVVSAPTLIADLSQRGIDRVSHFTWREQAIRIVEGIKNAL